MSVRKKLIEVALPLEAISAESSLRKRKAPAGYPTTIHKWWAQRPLAACRAVLFASIVDDPSSHPELFSDEEQDRERQRLFRLIEELIKWENSNNEQVLKAARDEIIKATGGKPPPVLDPFCGGGSIPLEAQRLGLEAHASDLNPVAVLITKALLELPAKFAGRSPVNPRLRERFSFDDGGGARAQGLAEDVRYYGRWISDRANERLAQFYPAASLSDGSEATVVAWLWARTARCPNPACGATMPLVSTFKLATRTGKERFLTPVVDATSRSVQFEVSSEPPEIEPPKVGRGSRFRCLVCGQIADDGHIKAEGQQRRMGQQLLAIVAEHDGRRVFLPADSVHEEIALRALPEWDPPGQLADDPRSIWCVPYGLSGFADLFTSRQLVALETFTALVSAARDQVLADGGEEGYADAVATYLAFAISRLADYGNSLASWRPKDNAMRSLFAQQSIPMIWDFAEGNPFGRSSSGFVECVSVVARCIDEAPASAGAITQQLDATTAVDAVDRPLVCTDPPYYDNVPYANLSDFFYVWLRKSLSPIYPDLFSTLLTPKSQELVASPYRFDGNRSAADKFFEQGLGASFQQLRAAENPDYPVTVFYAFKQAEAAGDGSVASTGWETMLSGLFNSGFSVTGTWPMRTEGDNRSIGIGTNALASSIVLVCRPRPENAGLATRREFVAALRGELPAALRRLQQGSIAPVDLAQAAIGPGMAIFSRYARVVEASGEPMTVRTALGLINQALDELLAEQDADFDADTRFCITWFDQRAFEDGPFGEADVLARAKNTSVQGLVDAGVVASRAGKVRLLALDDLADGWDPVTDRRPTVWEATHHLIKQLDTGGESAASALLQRLGAGYGQTARELAYRLYGVCERKGWAPEALSYNALVVAWPEIARRVAGTPEADAQQQLEV